MNRKTTNLFDIVALLMLLSLSSCEMEIYTGPDDIDELRNRQVKITSEPSGFLITLNNVNQGLLTPDSLTWLRDDQNSVTLSRRYYRDSTFSVTFDSNHLHVNKHIDFSTNLSMRGSINCSSEPIGAEIILDGIPTGQVTPSVLELLHPGQYKLQYDLFNYESAVYEIELFSGMQFKADTALVDTSVWVIYNNQKYNIPLDEATSIVTDRNSVTWVGLNNRGLARFENNEWSIFNTINSALPDNFISELIVTNTGIAAATSGGLYIREGEVERVFYSDNSNLNQDLVTTIQNGSNGELLIGATTSFFTYINDDWNSWNPLNSNIPESSIKVIEVDDQNVIWIGTQIGLAKLVDNDWFQLTEQDFASFNITASTHNAIGEIYFATSNSGIASLVKYSGGVWSTIETISIGGIISDIAIDQNNNIWMTTNAGLYKFDGQLHEYNIYNSELRSNTLTGIDIDSKGNIWITTGNIGVIKYKIYND